MRYSEDLIEEIRMKNDIVDVISGYVKLQRKGSSYFGLCPFHNEKSPSFSVSPSKQMYYCFGCGAGGNVFTFLMEYEKYTFVEAVQALAERAGVELPQLEYSKEAQREADLKALILEINKTAASFYYYNLRSQQGSTALRYLRDRGLGDGIMNRFGLGFSDKSGSSLYQYLKSKKYPDEVLKQSGLFQVDEKRGMYDKFWNRVIFPIMDVNNRVIGFGGRVMGDGKPKYLNSPETKVFDKSMNLFGLNVAKSTRKHYIMVCEGYMDVISLHQAGFTNAVASLGTAFTSRQANILKRYTDDVILLYDSDEAGIKAALRAIPMLREVGITAKSADLTPYKDPDEFIKNMGEEAFQERIDHALNGFMFEIKASRDKYDMKDPQGRTDFQMDTARRLCRFENEIERENYLQAAAEFCNISADSLRKAVNRIALSGVGMTETVKPRSGISKNREKENGYKLSQKLMLTWMTSFPEIFKGIEGVITPEDFTDPLYHTVAQMLFEQHKAGQVNPARLLNSFADGEEQKEVASVFHARIPLETEEEKKRAVLDVICRLKEESIAQRTKMLDPKDMQGFMDIVNDKKDLEALRAGRVRLNISFGQEQNINK